MKNPELETLQKLAEQVERAVAFLEASGMKAMSKDEMAIWEFKFGDRFDFVIGDFGITLLNP